MSLIQKVQKGDIESALVIHTHSSVFPGFVDEVRGAIVARSAGFYAAAFTQATDPRKVADRCASAGAIGPVSTVALAKNPRQG